MPLPSQIIPANEYRRVRWKNGLGWTREILRIPDREDWDLRLSIAEIEQDAAFSSFPGVDRELILLRGNGLRLRFGSGEVVDLEPPHGRLRFPGEAEVIGSLRDGPTHDFNVMWKRGTVEVEVLHRPLVGPMLFFVEPGTCWAVHLLSGHGDFVDDADLPSLETGDTALLCDSGERRRYILEGGGELLAIRIRTLAATAPVAAVQ